MRRYRVVTQGANGGRASAFYDADYYVIDERGVLEMFDDKDLMVAVFAPEAWVSLFRGVEEE